MINESAEMDNRVSIRPFEDQVSPESYHFLGNIVEKNDLDLRQYSDKVTNELNHMVTSLLENCISLSKESGNLYQHLNLAENSLQSLQNILQSSEIELKGVVNEVGYIKDKTNSINYYLKNVKLLETEVSNYIETLCLHPELIINLANGPIDSSYISNLNQFELFIDKIEKKEFLQSKALKDLTPEIEKLKHRITGRVRNHLIVILEQLKKPRTNIGIIQQNVLMKWKPLFLFLKNRNGSVFQEILNIYFEIMNTIYAGYFQAYVKQIAKFPYEIYSQNDLISEDGLENNLKSKSMIFVLGERLKIVENKDEEPIVCHSIIQKTLKGNLKIENIFKSINGLLINALVSEYLCVSKLFDIPLKDVAQHFNLIFSLPLNLSLTWFNDYVNKTYDFFGLLIISLINQNNKKYLSSANFPLLNHYLEKIENIIWPKIQSLLDFHIQSMQISNLNLIKCLGISVASVSRKYVEFIQGLMIINKISQSEILDIRIKRGSNLILELLKVMSEKQNSDTNKLIFLINNFDYIIRFLKNKGIEVTDDNQISADYKSFVEAYTTLSIQRYFRNLHDTVSMCCPNSKNEFEESKDIEVMGLPKNISRQQFEKLSDEFLSSWKSKIRDIRNVIEEQMGKNENSKIIFSKIMRDLMSKYSTLAEIIRINFPDFYKTMEAQQTLLAMKTLLINDQ